MNPPDLHFTIEAAEALRFAASPYIAFKLRVTTAAPQTVHTVILRCQIQIDCSGRHYSAHEQERLGDLFGQRERWGETLRSMLWANTSIVLPTFDETIVTDLAVPCTFDFNVSMTKYFGGLEDGEIPLSFYFSGTIFYSSAEEALRAGQISWEKEAAYRMPVRIWRDMMDAYYPKTAWLCLERNAFDRLYEYKIRHGLPTFEQALLQATQALETTTP